VSSTAPCAAPRSPLRDPPGSREPGCAPAHRTASQKSKAAGLDNTGRRLDDNGRMDAPNGRWAPVSRCGSARSVNGGAAQTLDFVLEVQLATLEFQDGQIVGRGMLLSLCELALQGPVPELKFRKMRLYGHRGSLLLGQI
jgi:hypothetical protein